MPDADAIRKDAELVVDVCMSVEADDVPTRQPSSRRSASIAAPGR
jgi:hypothetical protein